LPFLRSTTSWSACLSVKVPGQPALQCCLATVHMCIDYLTFELLMYLHTCNIFQISIFMISVGLACCFTHFPTTTLIIE